ncbi:pathogenesis-related thaumatin superfamily protein [Striga asiatica]|uniref:Pathogenesis-related thaumatin superfamily protein n=1 Tax=Striga asiatica TaxID=4170 RepID=A0A5A7PR39_STRAF|nr:pathogenesis-related thaumatin superfamily protein [Striga asiatica]
MWARTGCNFNESGHGPCETGDCRGQLACWGSGGRPPATVVEMTLGTAADPETHYYDVSLVDGFNLPASMVPAAGGACGVAACETDVNAYCPDSLAERGPGGRVVGCKSACVATGADKYCCTGEYGSARACKPTSFANLFKALCPRAYSYAYDEAGGLKTCSRAKRYVVTFCPPN